MRLLMSNKFIIAVNEIKDDNVIGFDLFTENLVITKLSECIECNEVLSKLLSNKQFQLLVANNIADNNSKQAGKLLGISERTYFRYMKDYYNQPEDKK